MTSCLEDSKQGKIERSTPDTIDVMQLKTIQYIVSQILQMR